MLGKNINITDKKKSIFCRNDAMSTNAINLVNDRCFPPQIESDEAECEYRATRDIHRGEELLVSYKEFTVDNHTAMGL